MYKERVTLTQHVQGKGAGRTQQEQGGKLVSGVLSMSTKQTWGGVLGG